MKYGVKEIKKPKSIRKRLLVALGTLLVVGFLYLLLGQDVVKTLRVNHVANTLAVPKTWVLTHEEQTPNNFLGNCLTYTDVSCPAKNETFKISPGMDIVMQISTLKAVLLGDGYVQRDGCLSSSCQNIFIKMSRDHIIIRASAQKGLNGGDYVVYVDIEQD